MDSNPYVVKQIIESPASHMACIGLKELVVGENAFDIEKIWRKMYFLWYIRNRIDRTGGNNFQMVMSIRFWFLDLCDHNAYKILSL